MTDTERRALGRRFDEDPDLYDRVRPAYPEALVDDLVRVTGLDAASSVLEVGCGTGQATQALASRVGSVTAVEPGAGMAASARRRVTGLGDVTVEEASFEDWDDDGRRFDAVVAASSWHWVDPAVGWPKAHAVLRDGGWMALLGHVVVASAGEPEVYAETADLHQRFCPGNPGWGRPPSVEEVRRTGSAPGWTTGSPGTTWSCSAPAGGCRRPPRRPRRTGPSREAAAHDLVVVTRL